MRDFDETWVFKTNEFLEHAFGPAARGETLLRCPCSYCDNRKRLTKDKMGRHLVKHGFTSGYTRWIYHGESHRMREEVVRARVEAFDGDGGVADMIDDYHQAEFAEGRTTEEMEAFAKAFEDMFASAQKPLHNGTTVSQLDAVGRVMGFKS
jgi:hypothetical protein